MDLDFLKTFALTEKTQEDIETIMSMTQGLPFVINYNNPDVHKLICQNMKFKKYLEKETIYDSAKQNNIDFLIYSGSINLYISQKINGNDHMQLMREANKGDCFGSFEFHIMKKNQTKFDKIMAIANDLCKLIIFENKKDDSIIPLKTKREVMATQREVNKDNFDPEIFLFDNPQKINGIIDSVKVKISEEFANANKFDGIINKLKTEKEFKDILNNFPQKRECKEVFNWIDDKYGKEYSDIAILDLKLGIVSLKSIESLPKSEGEILAALEELKEKFYDKSNAKNKNLLQMNIEKELENEDFHEYIYEELSKIKDLDELVQKKKKNDMKIEQNKRQIKREENLLLNSYYCIYCHIRPRDAISTNCQHLVICEDCMKKTKICPRCGVNIDNYHKIYRS